MRMPPSFGFFKRRSDPPNLENYPQGVMRHSKGLHSGNWGRVQESPLEEEVFAAENVKGSKALFSGFRLSG